MNGLLLRAPLQTTPSSSAFIYQREVGGIIRAPGHRFTVQHHVFQAQCGDHNTLRIGVAIGARH